MPGGVSLHSWMILSNRITEKRRLAIAAAAMVTRMTRRSKPLVFLPVSPSKNWLPTETAIMLTKACRMISFRSRKLQKCVGVAVLSMSWQVPSRTGACCSVDLWLNSCWGCPPTGLEADWTRDERVSTSLAHLGSKTSHLLCLTHDTITAFRYSYFKSKTLLQSG